MSFIINGLHSQRSYSSRYGSEAPGFTLKPGGLASGLALTSSVTLVEPGCLSGTQFPHLESNRLSTSPGWALRWSRTTNIYSRWIIDPWVAPSTCSQRRSKQRSAQWGRRDPGKEDREKGHIPKIWFPMSPYSTPSHPAASNYYKTKKARGWATRSLAVLADVCWCCEHKPSLVHPFCHPLLLLHPCQPVEAELVGLWAPGSDI